MMKYYKIALKNYIKLLSSYSLYPVIIFALIVVLSSCKHAPKSTFDGISVDSLHKICEKYALELKIDTLRMAATAYQKAVPEYSKDYFHAHLFALLADFNAKQYNKVLEELDNADSMPHFKDYPEIQCRYQYTRSRCYQYSGQKEDAIAGFKKCLIYNSNNESGRKIIQTVTVNAMMQMLNIYLINGRLDSYVDYLKSLQKNPTPIIRQYCLRDLYSMLAYSFTELENDAEAKKYMSEALKMPLYNANPQKLFRDYSYAASIYRYDKDHSLSIEFCKKALAAAKEDNMTAGIQWTTSLLGDIYKEEGRIDEAVSLYQESIKESKKKNDLDGEVNAYSDLSSVYLHWKLFKQANEYANIAINLATSQNDTYPRLAGSSFVIKGEVMYNMNQKDSTRYYLLKADSCFKGIEYDSGQGEMDKILGRIMIDSSSAKDIQKGITCLNRLITNSPDISDRAFAFFQLGKCYINKKEVGKGEALLDSMYAVLHSSKSPCYVDGAYSFALNHYLSVHNAAKIALYAAAYQQEMETSFNERIEKRVAEAMIKYQTDKKEQQLSLTLAKLKNKELHGQIFLILAIGLVILIFVSSGWYIYNMRLQRLKRGLVEQRLDSLMGDLEHTKLRSNEIEKQFTKLVTDMESWQQIAAFTPQLFKEKGGAEFRERFNQLYPAFIPNLKEKVPNVSRTEEILAMLIVMDQTSDQIAENLCIAKSSVNMARHRLRQKMNLDKDTPLEDVIKSLLKNY